MDVYLVCVYRVSFICPSHSLELSFDTCVILNSSSLTHQPLIRVSRQSGDRSDTSVSCAIGGRPLAAQQDHPFSPGLLYPVASTSPRSSHILDLSRSSLSFGIPALPQRMLPLPAITQAIIIFVLMYESGVSDRIV